MRLLYCKKSLTPIPPGKGNGKPTKRNFFVNFSETFSNEMGRILKDVYKYLKSKCLIRTYQNTSHTL